MLAKQIKIQNIIQSLERGIVIMNKRIVLSVALLATMFQAQASFEGKIAGGLIGAAALFLIGKAAANTETFATATEKFDQLKDTYWNAKSTIAAEVTSDVKEVAPEIVNVIQPAPAPFYSKAINAISKAAVSSKDAIKNFSCKTLESAEHNKYYILGAVAVAAGAYAGYKLYNYVNQPSEDEQA